MRRALLAVLTLAGAFASGVSAAGEVSFSVSYSLQLSPAGVDLQLEIRNLGNEAASAVRPFLSPSLEMGEMGAGPVELNGAPSLAHGSSFKTEFHGAGGPFRVPGHYILPLDLRWKDLRGFDFVNTLVLETDYRGVVPPALELEIPETRFPREREAVITVRNRSPKIRFSQVGLWVASAMSAVRIELPGGDALPFALEPGSERQVRIGVSTNGRAVAGDYSNFLIAEGEADGLHFEVAAPVVVHLATEEPGMAALFSRGNIRVAFWALLLLTTGLLGAGWRSTKRAR